jgi:uncharacterized protein YjbJ (UPF0337 family)
MKYEGNFSQSTKGNKAMTRKDKAKNAAQIVRGKMKRNAGDAAGDRGLSAEGRADEAMGHLKQAAEHVKDVFKK